MRSFVLFLFLSIVFNTIHSGKVVSAASVESVRIGLNYPQTGVYKILGTDQIRAASLAAQEINSAGGILGKNIELVTRDSQSLVEVTYKNVKELIDEEKVAMVFGGSSSSVAIAAADVCRQKGVIFFGTLTYSNATTGSEGNRYTFRECNDSWMAAKTLAAYLNEKHSSDKNKYFYITADYTWGHTTEDSMRLFTGTADRRRHKGILTRFPGATDQDFRRAVSFAKMVNPDVLVLVLFGKDMSTAIREATIQGLKSKMQIVVPNLTLGMAESGGPKVMEDVIGTLPWSWVIPYKYNYPKGKDFVEAFASKYHRYPSTSGASAYTILYEYKEAVERAGTFDSAAVIKELEGHTYQHLKDEQVWRDFDHQSVQTVYAVKCRKAQDVLKDKFKLDYFEVINSLPGDKAVMNREEWNIERAKAGKPLQLEAL